MDRNNLNKTDKIIFDCYIELYKHSIPSADFNQLVESATINKYGEKEIPFNDYEIDKDIYDKILEKYSKKFKKYKRQLFKNTINLGCSPKFKK